MGMKVQEQMAETLSSATQGVSQAILTLRDLGRNEDADELMLIREVLVQWAKRAVRRAGPPMGRRAVPPMPLPARQVRQPSLRQAISAREHAVLLKQLRGEVANG